MGQQRGHQAQQQAKAADRQPGRSAPALNRTEDPVDAVQALLGSRAASRQWRNELQQENQSRPLHQLLQTVATASPRVQAKPLFRGVSQEWGAATSGLVVQPKLTIGAPNDRYEQEADRVAQQVVQRLHSPAAGTSQPNPTLQRDTLPDDNELQMKSILQRDVDPEEEDELQMKPLSQGGGAVAASDGLETAIQQSRGGGQPLADSIREPMEQAFGGVDFSGVKVHTDAQSDQLNHSIQAKAFTTGQNIFFRQGSYNPKSQEGNVLLAHELTHVIQQGSSNQGEEKEGERPVGTTTGTGRKPRRASIYSGDTEPISRSGSDIQRIFIGPGGQQISELDGQPLVAGGNAVLGVVSEAYSIQELITNFVGKMGDRTDHASLYLEYIDVNGTNQEWRYELIGVPDNTVLAAPNRLHVVANEKGTMAPSYGQWNNPGSAYYNRIGRVKSLRINPAQVQTVLVEINRLRQLIAMNPDRVDLMANRWSGSTGSQGGTLWNCTHFVLMVCASIGWDPRPATMKAFTAITGLDLPVQLTEGGVLGQPGVGGGRPLSLPYS